MYLAFPFCSKLVPYQFTKVWLKSYIPLSISNSFFISGKNMPDAKVFSWNKHLIVRRWKINSKNNIAVSLNSMSINSDLPLNSWVKKSIYSANTTKLILFYYFYFHIGGILFNLKNAGLFKSEIHKFWGINRTARFEKCKQFLEYQKHLLVRDIWWSKLQSIFKCCLFFQHQC